MVGLTATARHGVVTAAAGVKFAGVGWEEGIGGEAKTAEHLAGVVVALLDADFLGHTEVVDRHEHLNLTLELDYHEYAECYENGAFAATVVEAAAEATADRAWDAAAIAWLTNGDQSGAQTDGLGDLAGNARQIAAGLSLQVIVVTDIFRAEDLDTALAAEENGLLGADTKTADLAGVAHGGNGYIEAYAEIDGQLNAVVAAVEGDGLGVDKDVAHLGGLELDGDGVVDELLVALDKVDADVLETFAVAAGIIDAAGVNADSLLETILVRNARLETVIVHGRYLRK